MKKLKLFCLLPSLCLASCSSVSYVGVYEFRLGKTDGAHFGLSVELKDDAYEKREGMKQMFLSADLGSEFSIKTIADQYIEEYPFLADVLEKLVNAIPEDHRIDAYYKVTDYKHAKYGKRVMVGSDFLQELFEKAFPEYSEILEDLVQLVFPDKSLSSLTEPEMIEMITCAYVNDKQFTFQIPVSQEDLFQQLAWYGYLIDQDASTMLRKLDLDKLPGPTGEERYGVHPTVKKDDKGNILSSEVDQMNATFEYEFSHTYLYNVDEFGLEEAVGSFIYKVNESNQKYLCFEPFDSSLGPNEVTGKLKINKGLPGESYVDVKFSFSQNSKETSFEYNGKTGKEEGFIDANGTEVTFKSFYQEPFEFRDFHDVNVGLSKV